ncbi:MAG: YIP1 family protein [Candidatus Nanoarchaeia archaeon]
MKRGYLQKYKDLFLHPKQFFKAVEKEKKYTPGLFFYVKIAAIVIIVNLIFTFINSFRNGQLESSLVGIILSNAIFSLGIAFAAPFISAAIVHLGVLVFGGRKGYFNTFKPSAYSISLQEGYSLLLLIIGEIFALFIFNADLMNQLAAMQTLQDFPISMLVFLIISAIIYIVALINVLYVETIGIAKFQKMSKGKAFLSIIFVPVIVLLILSALVYVGFI